MELTDTQKAVIGLMTDAYIGDKTTYREQLRASNDLALADMAAFVAMRIPQVNVDIQVATANLSTAQSLLALFQSV